MGFMAINEHEGIEKSMKEHWERAGALEHQWGPGFRGGENPCSGKCVDKFV